MVRESCAGTLNCPWPGIRRPLTSTRSTGIHDKQPTLICSGRAIYFKWHFCSLNKSTLVTWINPLHPDSAPSHKSAWTVRSAGTRGGSAHPLLNGYRGKHRAGSDWNPGLPFQITLALVSPSRDWAQSKAELPGQPGVPVAKTFGITRKQLPEQ